MVMGTRWGVLLLVGLLLVGCGGGASGDERGGRPAKQHNGALSAQELEKATTEAFARESTYRAAIDWSTDGTTVRLRMKAGGPSRYSGRGQLAGLEAILNGSGTTYVRFGEMAGLPPDLTAVLAHVGDRWITSARGVEMVEVLRWMDRSVRFSLVGGGAEGGHGEPVLGEERTVDGVATVAYRYPSGVEVRVPRAGAPLPLVIEAPDLTVRYRDYGADIVVEVPDVRETLPWGELFER
ncbi:hypothetical protein [Pimelobacter simplex]|uniref:hypothetical protein n=1 Tax=Nocardioides simplex TaxID=2045 RepID=UPI001932276F|nr:hypothetical protein [Pimelobacter simplex]